MIDFQEVKVNIYKLILWCLYGFMIKLEAMQFILDTFQEQNQMYAVYLWYDYFIEQ